MSVVSALRGAARQLFSSTAALSALRGARRQLSTSTTALPALRAAGWRQLYTSTIASRASGAYGFQIKDYTDVKRILGVGQDTTSDDFYVGDYRFRVLCCPNGSSEKYAGHVSVFLEYLSVRDINPIAKGDCIEEEPCKGQMSILPGKYSSNSTYSLTREEYRFKKCGDTWGWNNFISHEKLQGDPEPKQTGSKKKPKDTSADWWTNFIVKFQDGLETLPENHVKNDCLTLRYDVSIIDLYRTAD